MSFLYSVLSARKVLICIVIAATISIAISLLPLVGTLGFEYSVAVAFFCSFISVYLSSEYINLDVKTLYPQRRRYSDLISSGIFVNFFVLLFPFIVGLISSLIKEDCYIKEGIIFFMLIPVATIFFTSSLGLLIGNFYPRRGFLIGSMIILLIIFYSLWILYAEPPIFSYNYIFGFFPGPLYDQVIPIDNQLILFRAITLCWAVFFLLILKLSHDYSFKHIGAGTFVLSVCFGTILSLSVLYSNELGIKHTREYLIYNYFTDSFETENFIIYFFPGSKVSSNVDLIALDHEFRYSQLSDFLKVKSSNKIISYIYPDENTRKKLVGAGETTIANPIHDEIHLVYDTFPHPLLKHELTHVMSSEFGSGLLKISPRIGLVEGLAVAADWGELEGYTPHQWSSSLTSLYGNTDIENILGWGFWAAPAAASYTLMGSFVRYLIDTYGMEKFKHVYSSGEFDIYGITLSKLIRDWDYYLQRYDMTQEMPSITKRIYGRPSIFEDTCPRKSAHFAALGLYEYEKQNYYFASKYFEKALSFNPANVFMLESLAYSYFQDGNFYYLDRLLKNNRDVPDITFNIVRNLLANGKWIKGQRVEAESVFHELKQVTLPVDISSEIDIKIDALRYKNDIPKSIIDYYSTQDKIKRVAILEDLIRKYPWYSPSYYLLGRIFFYRWDFERSLEYLKQSEKLGLPGNMLEIDNARLLGTSLFIGGKYEQSLDIFQNIVKLTNGGRYHYISSDFIERLEWINTKIKDLK